MTWLVASASIVGSSHVGSRTPCQDHHAVNMLPETAGPGAGPTLVVAVADGAGSASRSAEGAKLASEGLVTALSKQLVPLQRPTVAILRSAVSEVRGHLLRNAELSAAPASAFATTLLGAVVTCDQAVFCQIGDGVSAYRRRGDTSWSAPLPPQRGQYANETFFLTDDDAEDRVELVAVEGVVDQLAMLTDGLEHQAFDVRSGVRSGFLDPLVQTMRSAPRGSDAELGDAMRRFLGSDEVNAQTTDDKTMVLALRRPSRWSREP